MNINENDSTIVLQVFDDFVEANVARNILQENGIESFLEDENVIGLNPLGGVQLRIFEKDLINAQEILSSSI
jgi:Putative prokaryotic signal transducing protein